MVDLGKIIFLLPFILTSCTVLKTAPKPEVGKIRFYQSNQLKNKAINIKFKDKRDDKNYQFEIQNLFQSILEDQVRALNGKTSPEGAEFVFTLNSYDIAYSNGTCTVIISYEFVYQSITDKQVVTDEIFPCESIIEKRKVAAQAINKMLKKISKDL